VRETSLRESSAVGFRGRERKGERRGGTRARDEPGKPETGGGGGARGLVCTRAQGVRGDRAGILRLLHTDTHTFGIHSLVCRYRNLRCIHFFICAMTHSYVL